MKLQRPASQGKRPARRRSLGGRLVRASLVAMGVLITVAVIVLLTNPAGVQRGFAAMEARWGSSLYNYDRPLAEKISVLVGNVLRDANTDVAELPELVIDVPFKGMRKIYAKREEALERGNLIQGPDDFVKGEIRVDGRTVPVKLRLKGDWNDHLAGRKWSFRIHVRKGKQLFGMRRFSIQNPSTRGFQSELMYFEALRGFGIMSPRYSFVDVTLNGEPMGIMALEEFFSKELLEHNRRREGVIVRFDESLVWESTDSLTGEAVGWKGAFDHFSNAAIDAMGSGTIAKSAVLSEQYRVAEGLLRGFVDGDLPASEVFDAEQMGRFIAVSDLFGAWHAIAWTNVRFYLNPITLRLEPIAYDATLQKHLEGSLSVINDEPLLLHIMQDPAILDVYQRTLVELDEMLASGELETMLRKVEAQHLPVLQSEFRLLSNYPLDYLRPRMDALLQRFGPDSATLASEFFLMWPDEQRVYARLAHVNLLQQNGDYTLELVSAVPKEVELVGLYWSNAQVGQVPVTDVNVPVVLPARGIGSAGQRVRMPVAPPPEPEGWQIVATVKLQNRPWTRDIAALDVNPPLTASPLPRGDINEQLSTHAFLNRDGNQLRVGQGRWTVAQNLVVPPGFSLTLEAGAELAFAADTVMVVHGPLQVAGTPELPVKLEAADGKGWPGLIVMNAGAPSSVAHLHISNTTGVRLDGWNLTGGFNFYASDVTISDSVLLDAHGEDALNIIQSEFEIRDTVIRGTASDAFDSDFSEGRVVDSQFIDVGRAGGGDAVDVSGTQIRVTGCEFVDVSDKALSVGERSQMEASNVTLRRVGTGAASKDGSTLQLSDSRIDTAAFAGLTAYIKKPEYGPAEIIATGVQIENTETVALAQTGSAVTVDGQAVEPQDVNVDALYDTIMRKGLQR